jgi:hypothetical protein
MSEFKLQHLITTGAREAEMIEALLNDNGIEIIVRHDESGDYTMLYMGYSAYNIELYVAQTDYNEAKELLESLNLENAEVLKKEAKKQKDQNEEDGNKSISFYLVQIEKIIIILYLLLHLLPIFLDIIK